MPPAFGSSLRHRLVGSLWSLTTSGAKERNINLLFYLLNEVCAVSPHIHITQGPLALASALTGPKFSLLVSPKPLQNQNCQVSRDTAALSGPNSRSGFRPLWQPT